MQQYVTVAPLQKGKRKMTVKELIDYLSNQKPDALVYTMAHDDDIALVVTDVKENILPGKDETVVLVF